VAVNVTLVARWRVSSTYVGMNIIFCKLSGWDLCGKNLGSKVTVARFWRYLGILIAFKSVSFVHKAWESIKDWSDSTLYVKTQFIPHTQSASSRKICRWILPRESKCCSLCKSSRVLPYVDKKKKESSNRPGVTYRFPGGLSSHISWHSAHEDGEVVSLTHRPPLFPGNVPGTHFH
jgi:hypothetical protein